LFLKPKIFITYNNSDAAGKIRGVCFNEYLLFREKYSPSKLPDRIKMVFLPNRSGKNI